MFVLKFVIVKHKKSISIGYRQESVATQNPEICVFFYSEQAGLHKKSVKTDLSLKYRII